MPIKMQKWIKRSDLRSNPETFYVFGDNLLGVGMGGQAREMRGEPNAVGIATKWSPSVYASDDEALAFISDWLDNFTYLMEKLEDGHLVVWPEDGIGTGLADMKNRAPILWQMLELLRINLFKDYHEDHH